MKSFRSVLAALMRSDAAETGDIATALDHVTEVAAEVMRVERASVWRFSTDRSELVCANLYERLTDRHMHGTILSARDKPRYFAALAEERSIAAHEAQRDPRTSEFTEKYLEPLGITSMIDAPVVVAGELAGVICFEHVGPGRVWHAWEELAAGSFADFVAMVLAAAQLREQAREIREAERALHARKAPQNLDDEDADDARTSARAALTAFFDELPGAFLVADPDDGSWRALNRTAKAYLGYYEAGLRPEELAEVWNDTDDRERILSKVRAGATKLRTVAKLRREDGSIAETRITAHAMQFDGASAIVLGLEAVEPKRPAPPPPEPRPEDAAARDPLTGAYSRQPFLKLLADELTRPSGPGAGLTLAVVDPDRMKQFNGKHGYAAGDAVLRAIGVVLGEAVRPSDIVGRYCGAQFMVALPRTSKENAARLIDAVRSVLTADPPEHDGRPFPVTVSVGVVERAAAEDLESLLRRAEDAARSARGAGGDRVVVA
ncbi:MAG TPA: sensor domain-containing diguanylate cyclase [Polyangiaceae bacterium]|nr:sensor domain-containing diguanylate cyclase [Polyangiaceae bacterium]